jgi:predicted exporter
VRALNKIIDVAIVQGIRHAGPPKAPPAPAAPSPTLIRVVQAAVEACNDDGTLEELLVLAVHSEALLPGSSTAHVDDVIVVRSRKTKGRGPC